MPEQTFEQVARANYPEADPERAAQLQRMTEMAAHMADSIASKRILMSHQEISAAILMGYWNGLMLALTNTGSAREMLRQASIPPDLLRHLEDNAARVLYNVAEEDLEKRHS